MVAYDLHLVDDINVGRAIRQERMKESLTLRELADRLKISQAKLSNIETGKATVHLGELAEIGRCLGVGIAAFFPRSRVLPYLIRRKEDIAAEAPIMRELAGPAPGPATNHNPVWPLAHHLVGKHMEPVLAQVRQLPDSDLQFIVHDHEEFMFVLSGEVETSIKTNEALVVERLAAGDCLYFRSHLPHCHRALSARPAETLHVMYSLRGAIDPQDGEVSLSGLRFYRRGVYADPIKELGEKIGLLRRSHGFTLDDVARDVGIGTRHLAQIERGDASPHVALLLRLARKFRRPLEYFLATTLATQPYYFVQRGERIHALPVHQRKTADGRDGSTIAHIFRPLADGFPDRGIHPYYVQVRTGTSEESVVPRAHHGQEFIYVLDGEIELVIEAGERMTELLRAGDSLFLESSVPHFLRSRSRNPFAVTGAAMIDVFWSPFGEDYLFDH